jgi:hypothetical protein
MEQKDKEIKGIGVPDGDGGSIERENRKDSLTQDSQDDSMLENDLDEENEEEDDEDDDSDWDGGRIQTETNTLGNREDEKENESIEGAMNNPGVKLSSGGSTLSFNNLGVEFYDSYKNQTKECPATSNPQQGFYFKGE